jgi:dihydrodipicolinate synthase/N-acetylneuraminate lyase
VIKRGLELRGREVGPVRPPMLPLTDEVDARLQQAVAAMRLPEKTA